MFSRSHVSKTLFFLATLTAGCSAPTPPTDEEIKSAIEQKMSIDYDNQRSTNKVDIKPTKPKLKEIKKIKCQIDADSTYICDVELEILYDDIPAKGIASFTFTKINNGWLAINK